MTDSGRRRGGRGRLVPVLTGLALVALLGTAAVQWVRRVADARAAYPQVEGEVQVAGVAETVSIVRDRRGVPHVEAAGAEDALFGLGFAHAQDRLGQMAWLRRTARGRTAEVIGATGLAADRLARTLGLGALGDAEAERLPAATRRALDAYVAGVNARLERVHTGAAGMPLLARRLGMPLERWTPGDSLAVLKLYAWGLSDVLEANVALEALLAELGGFGARRFFPRGSGEDALPVPSLRPLTAGLRRHAAPPPWRDPLRRTLGLEGRSAGSSAWVLGGKHTESGLPLLAGDAHLEPTAPALFHVAHLRGGDLDVAGATLPGLPGVWTGRNARVAWAATHAGAAVTDVYEETLHPSDPGLYHDGVDWKKLVARPETIRVRDADAVSLTIHSTRRGPLLEHVVADERAALSLAWVGMLPGRGETLTALLALARASDAEAARQALSGIREPALAVAYADASGAAGLQVAGWIPERPLNTGLVPVPGRARWYAWSGPIPFEALPRQTLVGGNGWLIAADNRWTSPTGGEPTEWLWRSGARARQIDARLREIVRAGRVGLRDLVELQNDVGEARGHELVRAALELAGAAEQLEVEAREVVELLRHWDGRSRSQSAGAAAYQVFVVALTEALLAPRLGEDLLQRYLAVPQTDPVQVVLEILREARREEGDAPWNEPQEVAAAVRESLRDTWFGLSSRLGAARSKWRWGRLHPLRFRIFGPRATAPAGLGPFEVGGSGATINTAEYAPGDPFAVRVTSVLRFAVDTAALDEVLYALAPGISEHPGHVHFDDGLAAWLAGNPSLLATSRLQVEEAGATRLLLEPLP